MSARTIPYMQTLTGRHWYPFDPRPEDVHFDDLRALSRISRYGGHTIVEHYSVAEHSVRVARYLCDNGATSRVCLAGLLHDAHEAYPPGDQLGPFLRAMRNGPLCNQAGISLGGFSGLLHVEARAKLAVRKALDVFDVFNDPVSAQLVKQADMTLLSTERRDLLAPSSVQWDPLPDPLHERIYPWSQVEAWDFFVSMFHILKKGF